MLDRYAPRPRRISIPAIGVSAAIVPLRLEPDGTMQTPDRFQDAGSLEQALSECAAADRWTQSQAAQWWHEHHQAETPHEMSVVETV